MVGLTQCLFKAEVMESYEVLLNAPSISIKKTPGLYLTAQAPYLLEPQVDEGPSRWIYQPGMHADWDATVTEPMLPPSSIYPLAFPGL
jgi:hypothetical protein